MLYSIAIFEDVHIALSFLAHDGDAGGPGGGGGRGASRER